ncbi:MAG TPA: DNA mismatch repair endonuclease MutL [Sediminispirochaeta sp.]|nr:DNA mismatch repair endonuclease MutL [Sediminispirochaeta sp.]
MNNEDKRSRRIQILRDSVAQKIAAGEVIDRPYSVVRELLDNAIDAGADSVELHLEQGGLKRIRLIDNGSGMSREDLELCYRPHATSKISSAEDLYHLQSLGFRGEALSSIAACAKLRITSKTEAAPAHSLEVREGKVIGLEVSRGSQGTVVDVSDLFYSMPGRKKFLKSPGAETAACSKTFLEKALAFPEIEFRYFTDGRMKHYLRSGSLLQRVGDLFKNQIDQNFLQEVRSTGGNFALHALLSSPAQHRRDRRHIHVYVNRRPIQEYSLMQAVHYAYQELLPGGSYPIAFLFLEIEPDMVDFNVHPAKREAKIKNLPEIHHQVVHSLKSVLNQKYSRPGSITGYHEKDSSLFDSSPAAVNGDGGSRKVSPPYPSSPAERKSPDLESWRQFAREKHQFPDSQSSDVIVSERAADEGVSFSDEPPLRYLGQVFDLFLLVAMEDQLYLIDQHAAHERILFDQINSGQLVRQKLLVPFSFELEEEEEEVLKNRLEIFHDMGIHLQRQAPGKWEITHLPAKFSGIEKGIVEALRSQISSEESFRSELFADLACKAAVKDGERLDDYSGLELARQAMSLPVPRCPHGRPIWLRISREELFVAVGRS